MKTWTTNSIVAVLVVAFAFGCGIDEPEAATTIDYVFDENGAVTTDYDGGIPEGAVTIRVRSATGESYSVHGSDLAEAVWKLRERSTRLSDDLAVGLADRPLFSPEDLNAMTSEQRTEVKAMAERAMAAIDAMPTREELAEMSSDEREAAIAKVWEMTSGRGK